MQFEMAYKGDLEKLTDYMQLKNINVDDLDKVWVFLEFYSFRMKELFCTGHVRENTSKLSNV